MLESKRKAIIFLTLSFLLAAAAGLLFLQKVKDLNTELGGMTKVFVAAEDIPSRTVIEPEQLETVEIPNRFVTESHILEAGDLQDKVFVVPLTKGDLVTKNIVKPVSNVREADHRLVFIPQSERIHFDQELESLDRIDIIVSHTFEDNPVTELFMNDVPVAGVSKKGSSLTGVAVEIPSGEAPDLIHMQNYADSIRVLKANVGKEEQQEVSEPAQNQEKQPENAGEPKSQTNDKPPHEQEETDKAETEPSKQD
ncbi:SAF domain-containing protein [Bacillus marinisedimentorum]|uniref:SAF domain-containing protein n=1 Tax=Bacillus marinisedimentorum TaxID=1821260 RepID=UPI00087236B9|nr:SAF domain-containing protein [Bacillus marinisedimentorum]